MSFVSGVVVRGWRRGRGGKRSWRMMMMMKGRGFGERRWGGGYVVDCLRGGGWRCPCQCLV